MTISVGNTSSNHRFSGDMLVFRGVKQQKPTTSDQASLVLTQCGSTRSTTTSMPWLIGDTNVTFRGVNWGPLKLAGCPRGIKKKWHQTANCLVFGGSCYIESCRISCRKIQYTLWNLFIPSVWSKHHLIPSALILEFSEPCATATLSNSW